MSRHFVILHSPEDATGALMLGDMLARHPRVHVATGLESSLHKTDEWLHEVWLRNGNAHHSGLLLPSDALTRRPQLLGQLQRGLSSQGSGVLHLSWRSAVARAAERLHAEAGRPTAPLSPSAESLRAVLRREDERERALLALSRSLLPARPPLTLHVERLSLALNETLSAAARFLGLPPPTRGEATPWPSLEAVWLLDGWHETGARQTAGGSGGISAAAAGGGGGGGGASPLAERMNMWEYSEMIAALKTAQLEEVLPLLQKIEALPTNSAHGRPSNVDRVAPLAPRSPLCLSLSRWHGHCGPACPHAMPLQSPIAHRAVLPSCTDTQADLRARRRCCSTCSVSGAARRCPARARPSPRGSMRRWRRPSARASPTCLHCASRLWAAAAVAAVAAAVAAAAAAGTSMAAAVALQQGGRRRCAGEGSRRSELPPTRPIDGARGLGWPASVAAAARLVRVVQTAAAR